MLSFPDTIIARASAPGNAVRGIIRISGPLAVEAVKTIVEKPDTIILQQHAVCLNTRIALPEECSTLPPFPAKLLVWPTGRSYTGVETVEIHTIGSPVLLDAIMSALLAIPPEMSRRIRLAEPGEFTLWAFLSGRLDLAQAEAVLGVIDASDNAALKTALRQLAGNVSAPLSTVRLGLFDMLAQLEAELDFAEEDLPTLSMQVLKNTLHEALKQIEQLRDKITARGLDGGKPKIVITGSPNVGKSTLFNKLVQREAALVSPIAGTTRDYLEAEIDWQGFPVVLIDTAGITERTAGKTIDELDETAQAKAWELLEQANVVVYCHENPSTRAGMPEHVSPRFQKLMLSARSIVFFQTKTLNESLDDLLQDVGEHLRRSPDYGMLHSTALRCREALCSASESLLQALELSDEALIALELRNAVNQLGLIDGTVHTEDILESIFSRFCIGK